MLAQSAFSLLALVAGLATAVPMAATVDMTGAAALEDRSAAVRSGLATIYLQYGVAGSCGNVNPDSAFIAALGNDWMHQQYKAPYCGRKIKMTNVGSNDVNVGGKGNSITVTVADTCAACDINHVDLSLGAWNALTNNSPYSTANIQWDFV